MTRRRWIADEWTATTAKLLGGQAQHLARVLRGKPGQEFDVVAGGHLFLARITSVSAAEVSFDLLEEQNPAAALPLSVLLAVSKFDRMEWALEKMTELGVSRIVPVLAQRTEKHLAQAAAKRHERWVRITHEAAKQSRRSDTPMVELPQPLPQALALPSDGAVKILLSETERDTPLLRALADTTSAAQHWLAIGTEGGWTAAEQTALHDARWRPVTLGPRILRVETAAISAVAAMAAAWLLAEMGPEESKGNDGTL